MEPPPQPTPSRRSTFTTTPTPTSRTSRSRVTATPTTPATPATPATPTTPATPAGHRRGRIRWTSEMEEAMLEGLIKAVNKGYRVDSSYKANGWKIALTCTIAVTQ